MQVMYNPEITLKSKGQGCELKVLHIYRRTVGEPQTFICVSLRTVGCKKLACVIQTTVVKRQGPWTSYFSTPLPVAAFPITVV